MTITVRYSCYACGLSKVELEVPARENEGVIAWTEFLKRSLREDHAKRSPDCTADSAQDVMIPITGTDRIGGPVLQ